MDMQNIERELMGLPVGKTRMIAWEAVTRWTENTWEIGTWGKKTTDLAGTLAGIVRAHAPKCVLCHEETVAEPGQACSACNGGEE